MMESKQTLSIVILLAIGIGNCIPDQNEDLIALESSNLENKDYLVLENEASQQNKRQTNHRSQIRNNRYSSRIENSETQYGMRKGNHVRNNLVNKVVAKNSKITEKVLDFRIRKDSENEVNLGEKGSKKDMIAADSANSPKLKKEVSKREEEEEEKTLAQQVADGKYGLIQNEIFANGSKKPGIISYLPNVEVPKDTKDNFGGLEKDEIWLAEDHVLVVQGGRLPETKDNETPDSSAWPPIDDYSAPTRQVKIPPNPKIPPPFPIRLKENGPLEFVKGENSSDYLPPPLIPPFPPPFPLRPNQSLPFPFAVPSPDDFPNGTFPFPIPPGPLPPFLGNLPPGAAFLPPPGNFTNFDEDDPSIYYPPKYDFIYPQDNSTAVPPGPLVPGIILPPPPDFFAPYENETETTSRDEENETDNDSRTLPRPPAFIGPGYLPVPRKPQKSYYGKIPQSSPPPPKPAVTYVYPENAKRKPTTVIPSNSLRTIKISGLKVPEEENVKGFTSPIYVPNNANHALYHALPTTSPKPNHITIPTTKSFSKEIYIVTTPEAEKKNRIPDVYGKTKVIKPSKYENINPEIHPLRSLIRPNVSVSYIGKYGHLPASTPFPFPKMQQKPQQNENAPIRGGHYITHAPDVTENVVTPVIPDVNQITVTPIPVVKKIRIRPVGEYSSQPATPSPNPSKATFYFYEEPPASPNPTAKPPQDTSTPTSQLVVVKDSLDKIKSPVKYYYSSVTTNKTPIRQFLEETFHSSNVLPNKPQIPHINNPDLINHGLYSPDIPKMKHLNYGTPIPPKSSVKYHYVTDQNSLLVPQHDIKALEIQNSGSSGLQTVKSGKYVSTTPDTIIHQHLFATTEKPEKLYSIQTTTPSTTPSSIEYNTDGPFVPSNYYATARPEHLHFTHPDHSLVDDITKNYFNIFGQKINSFSTTTPLAPVDVAQNLNKPIGHLQQSTPKPNSFSYYQDKNRLVASTPRPHSSFEQYLKEVTGEDQKEYIVTGVVPQPNKVKKGKGFPSPVYLQPISSHHLQDQGSYHRGYADPPPRYVYRPNYSTTLRPVTDVEIQPQYIRHVSSTVRPNRFRQYLQEITGFTSPTTVDPVKVKHVSLHDDVLVNYNSPRPEIDPDAEIVSDSNFKIVDPPDLGRSPHRPQPQTLDAAKEFFQNLPKSGYFSPSHQSPGNSFISYNLPGNGGHFYFLTPQIVTRQTNSDSNIRQTFSTKNKIISHDDNNNKNQDYLRRRRKKS